MARCHCVLCLLDNILLTVPVIMFDLVAIIERLEGVHHDNTGAASGVPPLAGAQWLGPPCVRRSRRPGAGRVHARVETDAKGQQRTQGRQAARDNADAFFHERPEPDFARAVQEFSRVAV